MVGYKFRVGELVQHRHYHYRGVVASQDDHCHADDQWYFSNRTQPGRDQPWYHVLVHGSSTTTYVAEENLEKDLGGEQVVNPLAKDLFLHFTRNGYEVRPDVHFPDLWSGEV